MDVALVLSREDTTLDVSVVPDKMLGGRDCEALVPGVEDSIEEEITVGDVLSELDTIGVAGEGGSDVTLETPAEDDTDTEAEGEVTRLVSEESPMLSLGAGTGDVGKDVGNCVDGSEFVVSRASSARNSLSSKKSKGMEFFSMT